MDRTLNEVKGLGCFTARGQQWTMGSRNSTPDPRVRGRWLVGDDLQWLTAGVGGAPGEEEAPSTGGSALRRPRPDQEAPSRKTQTS